MSGILDDLVALKKAMDEDLNGLKQRYPRWLDSPVDPYVIVHSGVRRIDPLAFDLAAAEFESTTGKKVVVDKYIPMGRSSE